MRARRRKTRPVRVQRAHPSAIILMRAAIFTGGALVSLFVLQVLGPELWRFAEQGALANMLTRYIGLMFSIGITAVAGGVFGFWLLPKARGLSNTRLLSTGAIFGVLAYVLFVPTLRYLGVYFGAMAYVAAAAMIALASGYVFGGPSRLPMRLR